MIFRLCKPKDTFFEQKESISQYKMVKKWEKKHTPTPSRRFTDMLMLELYKCWEMQRWSFEYGLFVFFINRVECVFLSH